MRLLPRPRVETTILGAATLLALAMGNGTAVTQFEYAKPPVTAAHDFTGVWTSVDGAVRLAMDPDGTYERSVTGRKQATRGAYSVDGVTVLLRDDNGLRTEVTYFEDALEMAGHRLYRD